jgi:hypothetical protein
MADASSDADDGAGRLVMPKPLMSFANDAGRRELGRAARGRSRREISTVLGRNLCRLKVSPSIFLSITEKDSKYDMRAPKML